MKTGIIILNYNDIENTKKMINQIKNYQALSKIVIVDNCSPNPKNKELKKLENEKIVFLESQENKGYGAGNNIGLNYLREHTDCELALISNPDIIVTEQTILEMQNVMKKNPNISFLGPVIHELGREIKGWRLPNLFVEVLSTMNFISRYAKRFQNYKEDYYQEDLTQVEVIHGSFFLARMKDFEIIHFFDENTFLYYEENIIGKKAKEYHLGIYVDNHVRVEHKLSQSVDKSLNKIKKYKILKQSMFYYEKEYNKRNFITLGFLKILYFLSLGIAYLTYWI